METKRDDRPAVGRLKSVRFRPARTGDRRGYRAVDGRRRTAAAAMALLRPTVLSSVRPSVRRSVYGAGHGVATVEEVYLVEIKSQRSNNADRIDEQININIANRTEAAEANRGRGPTKTTAKAPGGTAPSRQLELEPNCRRRGISSQLNRDYRSPNAVRVNIKCNGCLRRRIEDG